MKGRSSSRARSFVRPGRAAEDFVRMPARRRSPAISCCIRVRRRSSETQSGFGKPSISNIAGDLRNLTRISPAAATKWSISQITVRLGSLGRRRLRLNALLFLKIVGDRDNLIRRSTTCLPATRALCEWMARSVGAGGQAEALTPPGPPFVRGGNTGWPALLFPPLNEGEVRGGSSGAGPERAQSNRKALKKIARGVTPRRRAHPS
jgi:hypothetical protein